MLTIENISKINGYSLNVKGNSYYFKGWDNTTSDVAHFTLKDDVSASNPIESIKPVILMDTKTLENTHWYMIELTNRKQFLMLQLDRIGFLTGTEFILYELKLGQTYITINRYELMDMNIVVDKINKLILEQYVS